MKIMSSDAKIDVWNNGINDGFSITINNKELSFAKAKVATFDGKEMETIERWEVWNMDVEDNPVRINMDYILDCIKENISKE